MTDIPIVLRRLVIQRANNRCEYCGLSQLGQEATFHIDHILPSSAGGLTVKDNLVLACVSCSLYKGSRQLIPDPTSNEVVNVFNPRQQVWKEHFSWQGLEIMGLTIVGRATIHTLKLNRSRILAIRAEEEILDRHPPP
jgi:5-methylcytosine-specific restriction endonuclease McrA